jgi:uncharacterized protein YjiS (DUF1127 family)
MSTAEPSRRRLQASPRPKSGWMPDSGIQRGDDHARLFRPQMAASAENAGRIRTLGRFTENPKVRRFVWTVGNGRRTVHITLPIRHRSFSSSCSYSPDASALAAAHEQLARPQLREPADMSSFQTSQHSALLDHTFRQAACCAHTGLDGIIGLIAHWRKRAAARRKVGLLYALDDHLLNDIGITRSDLNCGRYGAVWSKTIPTRYHRNEQD